MGIADTSAQRKRSCWPDCAFFVFVSISDCRRRRPVEIVSATLLQILQRLRGANISIFRRRLSRRASVCRALERPDVVRSFQERADHPPASVPRKERPGIFRLFRCPAQQRDQAVFAADGVRSCRRVRPEKDQSSASGRNMVRHSLLPLFVRKMRSRAARTALSPSPSSWRLTRKSASTRRR